MGRITIFTVNNDPHCKCVTAALSKRDLPFSEISLSSHPDRLKDMVALTSCMSIPQVFFNTRHIGGVKETLNLLDDWDSNPRFMSPRDRYEAEIGRFPSPTSLRLDIPSRAPQPQQEEEPQAEESHSSSSIEHERSKSISLPDGTFASVFDVTEMLKEILPMKDLSYNLTTYKKSFTGCSAVKAVRKYFNGISEAEAAAFCQQLHEAKLLHHVCDDHEFHNTNKFFYRLQCYQTPYVLNSYRVWTTTMTELKNEHSITELMNYLHNMLVDVELDVMDENGIIDYAQVSNSKKFFRFEEAVCELQEINDLSGLDQTTLLAFRLNLYNLMLKYALIKIGITGHNQQHSRPSFLADVKFNVGGTLYPFLDWVRLISSETCLTPYAKIVCYALGISVWPRSCPPIKQFTSENIEEQLHIVASAFCQDDNNVIVNPKTREIGILELLRWHVPYFPVIKDQAVHLLLMDVVQGTKKLHLNNMLRHGKTPKVLFLDLMGRDKHVSDLIWSDDRPKRLSANEKKLSSFARYLGYPVRSSNAKSA